MAKAGSGNKGFSIDGFYVQGAIVYQTDAPPHANEFGSAWEEQNVLATQKIR